MKQFPTLYKRTKTGAIQQWSIEVVSYPEEKGAFIRKRVGQFNSDKLTLHTEEVTGKNIGKANETTPEQQALLQAESDWKRKHDEGYKSLTDLGITTI